MTSLTNWPEATAHENRKKGFLSEGGKAESSRDKIDETAQSREQRKREGMEIRRQ